jgi:hypothetical protein
LAKCRYIENQIKVNISNTANCLPVMKGFEKRLPRSARRTRKPLQTDWIKFSRKPTWVKCTYEKCLHEWIYKGAGNWAECPICHNCMKVSAGKRHYGK